ncbi:MAG: hypothetical protein JSV42_11190 [Chloroflexota bacterium]|nr:MAG: hypothetical protein JSV42_11190 [Chloroflexota bacterium]
MVIFSSACAVDGLAEISMANRIYNQYGVDTFACGVITAFGLEPFEKGVINHQRTGGQGLYYGNTLWICFP